MLFKSVGLALLMIILIGIGLNWLFDWLTNAGSAWAEASVGGHTVWNVISWIIKIAAALGVITGAIFLMPAVTAFVGSFFVDEIGEIVERTHYPAEPPGRALPLMTAMIEGIKTRAPCHRNLSLRAAVSAVRGPRPRDHVFRHRMAAQPRIFSARRHALSLARRGQGDAAGQQHRAS